MLLIARRLSRQRFRIELVNNIYGRVIKKLIERAKRRKIFKRNKKGLEVKILSGLLYFFVHSLRKTSLFMSLFEEISHESVQKYYHRLKYILKEPKRKERRLITVDETIVRVGIRKCLFGLQ